MVRLKDTNLVSSEGSQPAFQFHYGTIKRVILRCCSISNVYFNSTMVRLKESSDPLVKFGQFNFNSTMVRLKATKLGEVHRL